MPIQGGGPAPFPCPEIGILPVVHPCAALTRGTLNYERLQSSVIDRRQPNGTKSRRANRVAVLPGRRRPRQPASCHGVGMPVATNYSIDRRPSSNRPRPTSRHRIPRSRSNFAPSRRRAPSPASTHSARSICPTCAYVLLQMVWTSRIRSARSRTERNQCRPQLRDFELQERPRPAIREPVRQVGDRSVEELSGAAPIAVARSGACQRVNRQIRLAER